MNLQNMPNYMGYTHVELMGIAEHPFDGSWGYQVTGYYAPTSRYGTPQDFMYMVDYLHSKGVGVILDWVPAHFPRDAPWACLFDGQPLYEHPDKRRGEHPDWGTLIFNYAMPQVSNFLVANAIFWMEKISCRWPESGRCRIYALSGLRAPKTENGFRTKDGGQQKLRSYGIFKTSEFYF